ncbi:hemolysin family protein [Paracoccus sp. TK19116]|uniref:Hemolysin family protein n=1 Tax=Paracoccus albicereus TaxID=2922394 RepID=A0ABT1MV35_9RHOB|nr:hemolysin family protein [Paracoccus albicereus]MCQ0971331.1 hemolysin family protein [Paracoccus albicereus]
MFLEILLVLILTLVNGVLAMSELAIVSSRTARLKVMAEGGSRGAAIAMKLAAEPGRFLSSVQIGITLVGVLAGAFSGATLGVRLSSALSQAGLSPSLAQTLGVGGVVMAITYLSLIFGELVPKQIALRAPEAAAARIAPLLNMIAMATAPLVWVLDRSGRLVLTLIGQAGPADRTMTDDEVRLVISEARNAGVMKKAETEMIAGVMRIADRTARGLMLPRHEVETVPLAASRAEIVARFRETGRSRLPVEDGSADAIVGVFRSADFLEADGEGNSPAPADRLVEAPVVRERMGALDVLEILRRSPAHMVLVYDEYGHFEGIVTAMDILQAITGDFIEEEQDEPRIVERQDGSLLVAGWMAVDEFAERMGITLATDREFDTVAGLVIDRMGRLPEVGETVSVGQWRIEVVDLDGRRIDKVLLTRDGAHDGLSG